MKNYITIVIALIVFLSVSVAIVLSACSEIETPPPIVETQPQSSGTSGSTAPQESETTGITEDTTAKPETAPPTTDIPETAVPDTTTADTTSPDDAHRHKTMEDYLNNRLDFNSVGAYYPRFFEAYSRLVADVLRKRENYDEFAQFVYTPGVDNTQLPDHYHMIRILKVTKEEMRPYLDGTIDFNESILYLTDEEIDILFSGDENLIRRELRANSAFYFDGGLYNLYDLSKCDDETIIAMNQNGELAEFVERMAGYFEDGYWPDWRVYMDPNNHTHICGGIIPKLLDRIASLT